MSDPTLPPAVAAKFAEYERQLVELNRGLERQERRRLIEEGRQKLVNFSEHRVGAGGMAATMRVDMPAVQHFLDGESGVLRHLPTKDIEAFFDSYLQVAPKVAFAADNEAGATGAPGTTSEGDVAAAQKFSEDFQAAAEQDDDFAQRFAEVANNFDPEDASDRAFVAAASARFDAFDQAAQKAFGPTKFDYTVRQYNAAQETSQAG